MLSRNKGDWHTDRFVAGFAFVCIMPLFDLLLRSSGAHVHVHVHARSVKVLEYRAAPVVLTHLHSGASVDATAPALVLLI